MLYAHTIMPPVSQPVPVEGLPPTGTLTPSMLVHETRNYLDVFDREIENLTVESVQDDESTWRVLRLASQNIRELVDAFAAGCTPPCFKMVNLQEIIFEQVILLERLATDRRVRFDFDFPIDPVQVSADTRTLGKAFKNLLKNAVESSQNASIVTVRVTPCLTTARIIISDTGCGMDADALALLGTPFHTTKPEGTGLGFHIAQTVIERHGGTIRVVSNISRGTRCIVSLPVLNGSGPACPGIH
ncbi:HAMP domain-containing histidine kinase [bacterium]|nr:HAMP domain-containing histidine kinase [candidate division CSSED10-310 bacterium]